MDSRGRRPNRKRSVSKDNTQNSAAALSLPFLEGLIDDGEITIGMVGSVCVAAAADDDIPYAVLVRRRGESLVQLLARLEQAVDKAMTLGIFTDQLNR